MKKLIFLTLFVATVFWTIPASSQEMGTPAEETVIGDLNGDGKLSIEDVQLSLRVALGIENLPQEKLFLGDLRPRSPWGGPLGDGKITMADTTAHLLLLLGLIRVESSWEIKIVKEKIVSTIDEIPGSPFPTYLIDGKFWEGGAVWDKDGKLLGTVNDVYHIPSLSGGSSSHLFGVDKYGNPIIELDPDGKDGAYILDLKTGKTKLVAPLWYSNPRFDRGYPILWMIELTDPRFEENRAFRKPEWSATIFLQENYRYFLASEGWLSECHHLFVAIDKDEEELRRTYPGHADWIYVSAFEAPYWAWGVKEAGAGPGPVTELPTYDYQILAGGISQGTTLEFYLYTPPAVVTGKGSGRWKQKDLDHRIQFETGFIGPKGGLLGGGSSACPIVLGSKVVGAGPDIATGPYYYFEYDEKGRKKGTVIIEQKPEKVRLPVFNYQLRSEIAEMKYCPSTSTLLVFDTEKEKFSLTDIGIEFFPDPTKGFVRIEGLCKGEEEDSLYIFAYIHTYGPEGWPPFLSVKEEVKYWYWKENVYRLKYYHSNLVIPAFVKKRLVEPTGDYPIVHKYD